MKKRLKKGCEIIVGKVLENVDNILKTNAEYSGRKETSFRDSRTKNKFEIITSTSRPEPELPPELELLPVDELFELLPPNNLLYKLSRQSLLESIRSKLYPSKISSTDKFLSTLEPIFPLLWLGSIDHFSSTCLDLSLIIVSQSRILCLITGLLCLVGIGSPDGAQFGK